MTGEHSFRRGRWAARTSPLLSLALAGVLACVLAACSSTPDAPPTVTSVVTAATIAPIGASSVPLGTTGPGLSPSGLTVFAASSLKDAFTEVGQQFRQDNPMVADLQFNFQGSQLLVTQLQQGAPADVFASADKAHMDKAVQAGLIDGEPSELARNALTVVLPNDNPANIQTLADLARPGVKISLADPTVPAGAYSEQVLDKLSVDPAYGADFKEKVLANVVSREDNVRQVLARVQLDQVDAGIVYTTDGMAANAASSGSVQPVKTLELPVQYNVTAVYYIAQMKGAPHPAVARTWIMYIMSSGGQATLAKYGFTAIESNTP